MMKESTMALVNFVADLFGIKANDILDGIQAHELMQKLYEVYYKVLGYSEKKESEVDPVHEGRGKSRSGTGLTPQEAIDNLNALFLNLMQQGMSYQDVVNADYYHLMEILNNDEKPKKEKSHGFSGFCKNIIVGKEETN
ncbi:hypothetical protein RCO48_04585 [Peribacillus frigoritolerans]|nr:hypothetical protein [Peribacillus frigoritolerans]